MKYVCKQVFYVEEYYYRTQQSLNHRDYYIQIDLDTSLSKKVHNIKNNPNPNLILTTRNTAGKNIL